MLFRNLLYLLLFSHTLLFAQIPSVQWQKNLGGTLDDYDTKIAQNNLGEIYVGGTSFSVNQDMVGNHGGSDVFIARLDEVNGTTSWKKVYGGTGNDEVISIEAVDNGGVAVIVKSGSSNGDFDQTGLWLVRLNSSGVEQSKTPYGGNPSSQGKVIQTSDGGFLIASNKTISSQGLDLWLIKTTSNGSLVWDRTTGGNSDEFSYDVVQMSGNYFVLGTTVSASVNSQSNHGSEDLIVCKYSLTGSLLITRLFGGSNKETAAALALGNGLGGPEILILGTTFSTNTGAFTSLKGASDFWLFGVDDSLTPSLFGSYLIGGDSTEYAAGIFFDPKNEEPWITGTTYSSVGSVGEPAVPNIATYRVFIGGAVQDPLILGGSLADSASAVIRTVDTGLLIAGHSNSSDGSLTNNKGGKDFWVIKLGSCRDELVIDNQNYSTSYSRTADRFIRILDTTFEGTESRVKLRSNYILMEPGFEVKSGVVFQTEIGGCP